MTPINNILIDLSTITHELHIKWIEFHITSGATMLYIITAGKYITSVTCFIAQCLSSTHIVDQLE